MKAIILAAGIASRLRPITYEKPKTLVEVNGKPMIGYILEALEKHGIMDIVVCIGYRGDQIIEYCRTEFPKLKYSFVDNQDYEETNNMYSLYLARKHLINDLLLMNADLVFDDSVIGGLANLKGTAVAVDTHSYFEESMKVIVKNSNIIHISKKIDQRDAFGCSIDVYRLGRQDLKILNQELIRIIENENDRNQWTEVLLDQLFQSGKVKAAPYKIGKAKWFEIDNYDDLAQAEILFNPHLPELSKRQVFFLDKDGTLTRDSRITSEAAHFLSELNKQHKSFYVLTNNSSKINTEHRKTLSAQGLKIKKSQIISSLDATVDYLHSTGLKKLFWVANKNVTKFLTEAGFIFEDINPEALLLTWDTEITYKKLETLVNLVRLGFPYFATHPDLVCPTGSGPIPDIGSFIEVVRIATEKIPDKIFGKPNLSMVTPTLKKMKLKESDAVMIGDRLYTDILLAENSNILSVLVLSGETDRSSYEFSETRADIVVKEISQLIPFISRPGHKPKNG